MAPVPASDPRDDESDAPALARRTSSKTDVTGGGTSQSIERPEVPPLACMRPSHRPCANQDLVDALKPLREWRLVEFGPGSPEAMSYSMALSAIIACPYRLASGREAREQLYKHKAKELYEQGFNTAEDMRKSGKFEKEFLYHDDIQLKIPRKDVESIAAFVQIQLDRLEPGAHIVIAGGYRRGKLESNDVDLLITYPHQDGKERGILRKLCRRLEAKGLIPLHGILSFSEPATLRSTRENKKASSFDSLDKALVVFRHPANATTRPREIYRRVDLIVCRWPSMGAAIVGWSGSTQFERDLRKHAEKLGYKFDSGGLRVRGTSEVVPTMMEKDVFRALKLKYIPPEHRNADP